MKLKNNTQPTDVSLICFSQNKVNTNAISIKVVRDSYQSVEAVKFENSRFYCERRGCNRL